MSHEDIYDRMMRREEQKHRKQIESKIPHLRDKQIYDSFPSKDILPDHAAIKILKDKTGLAENDIVESVNRLIEGRKIISKNGMKTNKLYLRKNPY
jgi:hypothetical protein